MVKRRENGTVIGFYLTQHELTVLNLIEDYIGFFNLDKQKEDMLDIDLFELDGNKVDLYKGNKVIVASMTIDEAFWAVSAVCGYNRKE